MSTQTQTATQTVSITAGDVRQVMAAVSREIRAICRTAAHAARDFDSDTAETDCGLLALQEVVSGFSLQFYVDNELVREYAYLIRDDGSLTTTGPSEEAPPTGYIPENARVRLTAISNPNVSKEHRDHWFQLLGWMPANPLSRPQGLTAQTYGSFASGTYGVQRQLLINPKFDQPVEPAQIVRKGGK